VYEKDSGGKVLHINMGITLIVVKWNRKKNQIMKAIRNEALQTYAK
jgi:hypothetical protein